MINKIPIAFMLSMCLNIQNTSAQTYQVKIKTSMGDIVLSLSDSTPLHRDNFLKLCRDNFFDSTLFHRVINHFVIQAGDPDSKRAKDTATLGEGDLGYKVPFEYRETLFHKRGALGMARDDNPEKASSACQFYIVTGRLGHDSLYTKALNRTGKEVPQWKKDIYNKIGGTPHLDTRYTVFGEVIKGMDIVDRISVVKTNEKDRPLKNIKIIKTFVYKK